MMSVKSLKQALMPLIWLNCIFCMGIFEIPRNRPRHFLSVLYVILMITGYSITLYKGLFIFQKAFKFDFMIFYFVVGISILVAFLTIILFWGKSKNMNSIIKRSSIADNTLEELGIKADYQETFRSVLSLMALWIGGMITICILNLIWTHDDDIGIGIALYSCICVCFPVMVNSVVDLTFASFVRCLQLKFQRTNTLINNLVLCVNESNIFKVNDRHEDTSIAFVMANYKNHKDKIMHLIQTLRHLHLEITRIAREVNSAYCLQLLLEMAVHFTVVTSTTYCLYSVFTGKLRIMASDKKIIAMIIWGSIYLVKIVLINWFCASVSTEACKTGEIIQSFEGSVIDNDVKEEIHQFTQQIVLNSLNFTAAGFFSIDNCLTGKFIATVTTYVVILIEMNTYNQPNTTCTT